MKARWQCGFARKGIYLRGDLSEGTLCARLSNRTVYDTIYAKNRKSVAPFLQLFSFFLKKLLFEQQIFHFRYAMDYTNDRACTLPLIHALPL